MAYTPNIWVDREGTTRYFETVDNDGALIFTPDYTQVTEMGTPVNADNMNHIEEGIAAGSFTKYKSTTTYAKDDLVTAIVDNELKVYKSLQDNNNANALTNTNFWEEVEFAGGGGGTYAMFDPVIKDHVLTYEETKGLELQGTYVYKNAVAGSRYGYPDFFSKCLEEYVEAERLGVQHITLGGKTIAMLVHPNGHMYYDAVSYKSAIDDWYNTFGIAWFYGIDTANERIFLPRNDYFFQLTGDTSKVNEYVSAGLPNIEGRFVTGGYGSDNIEGAFYGSTIATSRHDGGNDANYTAHSAVLDASRSSSIYGNSNTVQPPASNKLLYICVGNTTNYEGVSEIVNQGMDILTQVNQGIETRVAKEDLVEAQVIIETYVNGTSWYRVYSDGWCEQGGFISSVTSNTLSSATITFLKPFNNTNYFVSLEEVKNNNTSNAEATGGHAVYTKNTNSMIIATFSWTNGRLWEAKGYIA